VAGLGVANMVPIMFSAAGNRAGIPSAVAISTVTMVGYCGILVAPASIGWVAEHFGFRPTYAALALLLVMVALLAARVADADNLRREGVAAQPA
jgi:fucose permease